MKFFHNKLAFSQSIEQQMRTAWEFDCLENELLDDIITVAWHKYIQAQREEYRRTYDGPGTPVATVLTYNQEDRRYEDFPDCNGVGEPRFYLTRKDEALCPDCAQERDFEQLTADIAILTDVNQTEDELVCDECGNAIIVLR